MRLKVHCNTEGEKKKPEGTQSNSVGLLGLRGVNLGQVYCWIIWMNVPKI